MSGEDEDLSALGVPLDSVVKAVFGAMKTGGFLGSIKGIAETHRFGKMSVLSFFFSNDSQSQPW